MATEVRSQGRFFRNVYEGKVDFDTEQFLTEVQAQFQSEEVVDEVRTRLDILDEIAAQPEFADASEALRDRLTQIFTSGGDENAILGKLRELTEVEGADGQRISLRRFLKRERRTLGEQEYKDTLARKIANTRAHVVNLVAFYPDEGSTLNRLNDSLHTLEDTIRKSGSSVASAKSLEDKIRESSLFKRYEQLKSQFVKDWLSKFGGLSESEIAKLGPAEIQRMIQEHQRHQLTALLKTKVKPLETDMSEHLGIHDTLEGDYGNEAFWKSANMAVRNGFRNWVLGVVQAFGMLRGQRYAFFQSEAEKDCYMLFGLGLPRLEDVRQDTIRLVPYAKPFTRKAGYLLEIRKRDMGDPEEYHHELRHYALPFLFAFDALKEFQVSNELVSFFTSRY